MIAMPSLFDPLEAGALHLKNRVVMAPLTRSRAGASRVPNDLMREYYTQRAGAGLIISEATAISEEGYGWKDAPGAYTDAQMAGWKEITQSVHAAGGLMVLQLWHMGRLSHSDLTGMQPFSASAVAADGEHRSVHKPYEVPRAMTLDDIKRTISDYAACARRAIEAGFDGVEIHGANGYLIDQFLRDGSNKRNDIYGGHAKNRARFMLEVTQAVVDVVGAARTGIRLSSANGVQSMHDSDPYGTFTHAAAELNAFNLAYLHLKEPLDSNVALSGVRKVFKGALILNEGQDGASAQRYLDAGKADAIAFGTKFIANPDLPARLKANAPLNTPNPATFYKGGAEGYVDYPFMKDKAA
jgi:2,4-dienoyl-CoA reductase-like NADH-dependent reductase (Old Yellow Enzyme family)